MRAVPQFGVKEPGRAYPDRPAAFAVVERDDKIAIVRVDHPDGRKSVDLPGGGVDPGETPAQAAARECGEEAGIRIEAGEVFAHADHFFINDAGKSNNTRGQFLTARWTADAPDLKIEDDHTLAWVDPQEALLSLSRDAHAWALLAWLRR